MTMRPGSLRYMFSRRGLAIAMLTMAIYVVLLIPFKQFVILDTITEIRPAGAVPVVMAVLLGPGAALGSAFGNLIGDVLGGTLTMGSIGGFVGNFFFAYVAWAVWNELSSSIRTDFDTRSAGHFIVAAVVASVACGAIIALGLELTGLAPLVDMFGVITLNDIVWTCTLGLIITWLLYPRTIKYRRDMHLVDQE